MRKGLRLIKRVVALFIVLLLSIESFGAVVSDNDGSAQVEFGEWLFNTNVALNGRGGPVDPGDAWLPYFGTSTGFVRGLVRSSNKTYNQNIFCMNLTSDSLVDAFDSSKTMFYVNSNVRTSQFIEKFAPEIDSNTIVRGSLFKQSYGSDTNVNRCWISRPELRFRPLIANTILDTNTCFANDSNDYYKRLKIQYLKNSGFYSSDGTTNTYIYQGLPIYKPEEDGSLEFKIIINTNYDASLLPWVDPGSVLSKVKLRIKAKEFNIGSDTSEAIKMKVGTSSTPITSSTPKVDEATITPGELTSIQLEEMEKGKTYFLRWYVAGYQYGGEITYLSDGTFTSGS